MALLFKVQIIPTIATLIHLFEFRIQCFKYHEFELFKIFTIPGRTSIVYPIIIVAGKPIREYNHESEYQAQWDQR